jgi:hypothetical protein
VRSRRSRRKCDVRDPGREDRAQTFYAQVDLDEQRASDLTKAVMASNARLEDAQEGMGAFVGKRQPAWSNR